MSDDKLYADELGEELLRELAERQQFADSIVIKPYNEVKKVLDERAIASARKSAKGLVELFEPAGKR